MIRPLLAAAAALLIALPAGAAPKKPKAPPPVTPAPVVAAERAFAADGLALGVKQSFLKHMADDAIVFQPNPVNAREAIGAQPDAPGPKLEWWPTWAGIARSGDLGFTTGPYAVDGVRRGHYFTVWKKQPDGGWKWVYDGGTESSSRDAPGPDSKPGFLTMAPKIDAPAPDDAPDDAPEDAPEDAFAEVRQADGALNSGAAENLMAAYVAVLACEARVQGSPAPPAQGCASHKAELAGRGPKIDYSLLGGEASQAGDLAWTYGKAAWTLAGKPRRGHYVRIWQRRAEGWRLVYDQLLPVRERPPG